MRRIYENYDGEGHGESARPSPLSCLISLQSRAGTETAGLLCRESTTNTITFESHHNLPGKGFPLHFTDEKTEVREVHDLPQSQSFSAHILSGLGTAHWHFHLFSVVGKFCSGSLPGLVWVRA